MNRRIFCPVHRVRTMPKRQWVRRPRRSGRPSRMAAARRNDRQIRAIRLQARQVIPDGPDLHGHTAIAPGKATADSDIVEARFVDVVPSVRLVQAVDFVSDDPAFAGTMTMTWELSAENSGTRVVIRADDVPSGIAPGDHTLGMQSSLANLASFVEANRG